MGPYEHKQKLPSVCGSSIQPSTPNSNHVTAKCLCPATVFYTEVLRKTDKLLQSSLDGANFALPVHT